jgi:hypothetical protein
VKADAEMFKENTVDIKRKMWWKNRKVRITVKAVFHHAIFLDELRKKASHTA